MKGVYFLIFVFFITEGFAQKEANVWISGNDFGIYFNYNRFRLLGREPFFGIYRSAYLNGVTTKNRRWHQ